MLNYLNTDKPGGRLVRILYLEDHLLLREALGSLLERSMEVEIVGQAASAVEGLELLSQLNPDCVLADISLRDNDGLWFVREVRKAGNPVPILMLTMHEDDENVANAFDAGVNGYLVKSASHEDVLHAVKQVCSGGSYIHPSVAAGVVRQLRTARKEDESVLSKREREILSLAARGQSNLEIAETLFLSLSTVKTHLQSVFRKFAVRDRTQAILEAISRKELSSNGEIPSSVKK